MDLLLLGTLALSFNLVSILGMLVVLYLIYEDEYMDNGTITRHENTNKIKEETIHINASHEKPNSTLKEKTNLTNEKLSIYSRYRDIVEDMVFAHESGMNYIPFSEWSRQLDRNLFIKERPEELIIIANSLKSDLRRLADAFHYTVEDANGFLLRSSSSKYIPKMRKEDEIEKDI